MFFRAWTFGQEKEAGAWGRDEMRNVMGSLYAGGANNSGTGAFYTVTHDGGVCRVGSGDNIMDRMGLDTSRVVPTGPQNVPQHVWQPVCAYLGLTA